MKHDEFIGQVQHRARLDSRGAAERATRAVLEALTERMPSDEAHHLASQLPEEIGLEIESHRGPAGSFDVDGFYGRVADKAGVERSDAAFYARCVLQVLQDAVTPGQADQVKHVLPDEFRRLFESGGQQEGQRNVQA